MNYRVGLKLVSENAKTGPIPVSTTDSSTCPPDCTWFDECYAKYGHLALHWKAIDEGSRGISWGDFCAAIGKLPRRQIWRHNQAGDLPGDGKNIDFIALRMLVQANIGKYGFTYTHYPLTPRNLEAIEGSNALGFAINISCDSLTDLDRVRKITKAPAAVVLPSNTEVHSLRSNDGHKVVVCPATYRDDMNCARCQICTDRSEKRAVIGFPSHGSKRRTIDIKLIRS